MTEKLFYKDSHLSKFDAEVLSCVRAKRQQVKDSFAGWTEKQAKIMK